MPHLPVSEIGSSSGCGRYLSDRIRRGNRIDGKSVLRGSEAQIVGTGVHEIIQFVLSKPPHTRRDAARDMIDALEEMRTTMAVPSLIEEAAPQRFFSDGLSQHRIVNTWQSSIHLLNGALNFLDYLEKKIPPSAGKWEIKTEVSIHLDQISENGYKHSPPSSRLIFNEEIEIHGFIDLVYEYENIRILGELKTGSHDAVKEENWCRQVEVYADLWVEKNPEHRLACVAFHVRLTDGFKFFEPKGFEWDSFQNKDLKIGGPQCHSCSIRLSCQESESNISFSAFN